MNSQLIRFISGGNSEKVCSQSAFVGAISSTLVKIQNIKNKKLKWIYLSLHNYLSSDTSECKALIFVQYVNSKCIFSAPIPRKLLKDNTCCGAFSFLKAVQCALFC